ncbi:MAG: glycyl-radical enzyme activating protein [Sphaerochaetaceae bacterium]
MKGLVFDIKKFALHDGEGLRTTVFFKGCPLRCKWCQNPEGLDLKQRLWYFPNRCLHCNECIASCPRGALSEQSGHYHVKIDHVKCDLCGVCTEVCPTNALTFDSTYYSVEELVEEVVKDKIFYDVSGGGVTASGGDPVFQHKFVTQFLARCKAEGLHTTLESAMYTSREIIDALLPVVDNFIVDLKVFEEDDHIKWVGKSNRLIKENIEYLIGKGVNLLIRVPLIPGYTASQKNLAQIGQYIRSFGKDIPIELLNHNHFAHDKYEKMGIEYPVKNPSMQYSEEEMANFYTFLWEG